MGQIRQVASIRFLFAGCAIFLPAISLAHGLNQEHRKLGLVLAQLQSTNEDLMVEASCFEGRAGATASPLCEDLYRFSCAPGEWSDGTGAAGGDDLVRKQVVALKAKIAGKAAKDFERMIKTQKGAYLRRLALSAFGMSAAPGCTEGAKSREHCDRTVSEALGSQVVKNLFPPRAGLAPEGPRAASLRGLDLLQQNAAYRQLESAASAEAKAKLRDEATEKKIENDIYPKVQKLLVELIRRKVPDPKLREILSTKVAGIDFSGTDCAAPVPPDATGESYDPSLSATLEPNAFYTPAKNAFRFCNGFLLRNKSEFQIASVVAHELAHAIDPCLIGHGPRDFRFEYSDPLNRAASEKEYPFPGLLSCLREPTSIRADFIAPGAAASPDGPVGPGALGEGPAQRVEALGKKNRGAQRKNS